MNKRLYAVSFKTYYPCRKGEEKYLASSEAEALRAFYEEKPDVKRAVVQGLGQVWVSEVKQEGGIVEL